MQQSRLAILPFLFLSCALVIAVGVLASPAPSDAQGSPCEVTPRIDELSPTEFESVRPWLEAHQKGFVAVETALDSSVANDTVGTLARLKKGVIGVAPDPVNERLRIVIDPTIINQATLQATLSLAAASVIGEPPLVVSVQRGCNSASAIEQAYGAITAQAGKSALSPSMTIAIDPWTSTASAGIPEQDAASQAALESRNDPALSVSTVPDLQNWEGGRFNDSSPHWGGAAIYDRDRFLANNCTSAFTAVLPSGEKGGVTAGHCVKNDNTIRSGSQHYGVASGVSSGGAFDMARIKNDGDVFNRRIHAAPGSPSSRGIESAGDPSVGESVCQSGMRSGQTCDIFVLNNSTDFGTVRNTALGYRPTGNAGGSGDSGAPVYVRSGVLARIRGMVLGGPGETSPYVYFHKVETIKNYLGVSQIGGP